MGNCKDCKGCNCKPKPKTREPDKPITSYLEPLPRPHSDATSLMLPCSCDDPRAGTMRYHCLPCLRSYSNAVGYDGTINAAIEMKTISKIASDRLSELASEIKQKRRLTKDD